MTCFDWMSVARDAASRAGFHATPTRFDFETFCLDGEVAPCVQLLFQSITDIHIGPVARLGVYLPDFERDWCERNARSHPSSWVGSLPLSIDSSNLAPLRGRPWLSFQPSPEDMTAATDWLDRVFDYAATTWPTDLTDLIEGIRQECIAGRQGLWQFHGTPTKVRGLGGWLRRIHGADVTESLFRALPKRTDGYDIEVMLEPPEREGLSG